MEKKLFGKLKDGREVDAYLLKSGDCIAWIMNYGATILSLQPFGKEHVIGGYDELEVYEIDGSNQGATIGRVANRIANAEFSMDGAIYMLPQNNGAHCLHGGIGFKRKIWDVLEYTDTSILLSCFSPDGDDGFPGDLVTKVRYTLIDSTLVIDYKAIPGSKTPIALTNHSYFNLNGFADDIMNHEVMIYADRYTEVDKELIPTGNRPCVDGTPFDLRTYTRLSDVICGDFKGYDHNFILCPEIFKEFNDSRVGLVASVRSSKMIMNVYTDQPGVQFYTANFLSGKPDFKGGVERKYHGALCLEAQTEPNCVNHGEGFYDAGDTYTQTTVYEFINR